MYRINILLYFLMVHSFVLNGQKCIKIINNQNQGIPFATIVNSDNSYGAYTNENGEICIDLNLLTDTIYISSVGYKKIFVIKNDYLEKDRYLLLDLINELEEVVINSSKVKRNTFSTYNKSSLSIYKHIWNPNTNILCTGFIENTSEENAIIEKVKFILSSKKSDILDRFKVRFRFFENKNDKPHTEITQTSIVTELKPNAKILEYDITSNNISLPKNGIWIGLEVVGYYNSENIFIPLENGKSGKATYRNNGKIKSIDLISPSYDMVKTKNNKSAYTKDFLDRWRKGVRFDNSDTYYSPKIEITTSEN